MKKPLSWLIFSASAVLIIAFLLGIWAIFSPLSINNAISISNELRTVEGLKEATVSEEKDYSDQFLEHSWRFSDKSVVLRLYIPESQSIRQWYILYSSKGKILQGQGQTNQRESQFFNQLRLFHQNKIVDLATIEKVINAQEDKRLFFVACERAWKLFNQEAEL